MQVEENLQLRIRDSVSHKRPAQCKGKRWEYNYKAEDV